MDLKMLNAHLCATWDLHQIREMRREPMQAGLTAELASRFCGIVLPNVTREYPNKLDHVMAGAADVKGPRALHPMFYGSFDWHSCVHSYWLLARICRRFPALPVSAVIGRVIDQHFTVDNVAAELHYLNDAAHRSFERPYGLAWLLMLAAELARHTSAEGQRWFGILSPLAIECAARLRAYIQAADYPVRAGIHTNSAFAIVLGLEYAGVCRDEPLGKALRQKCHSWFSGDIDCPAWEPDGEDFLSPTLMEVLCMSHALAPHDFFTWLKRFLPRLAAREPENLFHPARVSDRTDPKFVHLDGVNLSRAWCWKSLGNLLATDDPRRAIAFQVADLHLAESLPHIADDYAGGHWLPTFAALALEVREGP
jgi:hypothetical protein